MKTDYATALRGFHPVGGQPIDTTELRKRIAALQAQMVHDGVRAVWLDASASLTYFTGLSLGVSERIHGALVPAAGAVIYVSPQFEAPKLQSLLRIPGEIAVWEEDENPFALIAAVIAQMVAPGRGLALDPATPFRFAAALMQAMEGSVTSAEAMIAAQRQVKSTAEIALMQAAMNASFEVQKAVHAGLREGMWSSEVTDFILAAHRAMGMKPLFAAVQFGEATAYPHGVPYPAAVTRRAIWCWSIWAAHCTAIAQISHGLMCLARPPPVSEQLWELERQAQTAAFAAARIGAACGDVDAAARQVLTDAGFGPGLSGAGLAASHRAWPGAGHSRRALYRARQCHTACRPACAFPSSPCCASMANVACGLKTLFT